MEKLFIEFEIDKHGGIQDGGFYTSSLWGYAVLKEW